MQVKITNTGDDSIMNWAFKYDAEGEINNLWNATVYDQQDDEYIIKNSGWNYEIAPGQSVNFGYTLVNDEFTTPDNFVLCSKRVEKTSGYEIDLNVVDQWNTGFKAELAIENTSDQPLEAWTASFDSNFTINNLWDGRILESSDNHYTVASEMWTNPIAPGYTKKIGFTALIDSEIIPEISNGVLTEVEINGNNENPNINWEDEPDTDGDGLPDKIEDYLGSDPNNIDTDSDGLSDYYEVVFTYTDPTKADTDDNGINDGDEDFDKDGLTNLEELENNTNPYIDDTDDDGLSDGNEVNTYRTDPLVADTDSDGLNDGDEIILSTNPLVQDTDRNGIIDSKEKFQQTFTHKVKNEDCAITEVIVDMECTGNINRTTSIKSVMDVDILCSEVVGLIGEPFEIETDSEFDKATLTFKIDKDKLGEIPFDNLLFLWYNEEENEFVELETVLEEESGTASIITTHFSKYMIVDKKAWFDAWAVEFNYNPSSDADHFESGIHYPTVKYNSVLTIDCSGSMDWNDSKNQRASAAEKFTEYMHTSDKIGVVLFTDTAKLVTPMTNDSALIKKGLKGIYSYGGTSFSAAINSAISAFSESDISTSNAENRIILLSDGEDGGSQYALSNALRDCVGKKIKVYTVGFGSANDDILRGIANLTGGVYFKALSSDDLVDIFAEIGYSKDFDMTDTDKDGLPDVVEVAGIRLQNGKILRDCDPTNPDTDGDGLLDGEEINPKPFYSSKIESNLGILIRRVQGYYFKMYSNPTLKDTDGDDYDDYVELTVYDSNPKISEVEFHRWNQGFISVDYAGTEGWLNDDKTTISYGGYQGWFFDDSTKQWNSLLDNGYVIQNYGCGLISPSDILLYLALSNPKYSTFETDLIEMDSLGNLTYDSYQTYIRMMHFSWFTIARGVGVNGISIANGINQYSWYNGLDLNASWNFSKRDLLSKIERMLDNDIPVTFSIGITSDNKGIWFYDWIPLENDKYNFQVQNYPFIVKGHYATITGLLIDDIKGQKFLEISSWGKRYYVNYDEYLDYVGITSNIVYIK